MTVYAGPRRGTLNTQIAYPGKLGGGIPQAPSGYAFLVDDAGNVLTDDAGVYLIVELV
jgi:hypothetical protein